MAKRPLTRQERALLAALELGRDVLGDQLRVGLGPDWTPGDD